jgi:pilus assembly protein Flp/PilA
MHMGWWPAPSHAAAGRAAPLGEETRMLYMPREEGQGLVEYALVLVLVAVVVLIILMVLGPGIGNIFSNVTGNI